MAHKKTDNGGKNYRSAKSGRWETSKNTVRTTGEHYSKSGGKSGSWSFQDRARAIARRDAAGLIKLADK